MSFLLTPLPSYAYTLIAVAIMIIFALRGAWRGLFRELFGITSLILAYPLSAPFGRSLSPFLPLQELPAFVMEPIATGLGGLVAYTALHIEFGLICRLLKLNAKHIGWRKHVYRYGGAILGVIFGAAIVLLLSWFVLIMGRLAASIPALSGAQTQSLTTELLTLPAKIVGTHEAGLAGSAIGSFAEKTNPVPAYMDNSLQIAEEVLKDPAKAAKLMEYAPIADIVKGEDVQSLMQDPEIQKMASEKNLLGIMNNPKTRELLESPEVQKMLQEISPEELLKVLQGE